MNTALSKTGERRLADAEAKIERGLSTFWEVGSALMQIRDERLYRADFGTFEDYCQHRWGITRRRANQLVEAAQMGTMVPIENERQARALAPVKEDPAEVREIYAEAQRRGDTSGAGLARVVAERQPTHEDATQSGSHQSGALGPDAAGPGDDEQLRDPAPSPAPKVALPEPTPDEKYRDALSGALNAALKLTTQFDDHEHNTAVMSLEKGSRDIYLGGLRSLARWIEAGLAAGEASPHLKAVN